MTLALEMRLPTVCGRLNDESLYRLVGDILTVNVSTARRPCTLMLYVVTLTKRLDSKGGSRNIEAETIVSEIS